MSEHDWQRAQRLETEWWGDCLHTYGEETKQRVYARHMGLTELQVDGRWPVYDLERRSVVDFGGGPASLLLKCANLGESLVVDPAPYPHWVNVRYCAAGIRWAQIRAELFPRDQRDLCRLDHTVGGFLRYDEGWMYNCLQHTEDPERVCRNLARSARYLRIFEWIEEPPNSMHPQVFVGLDLNNWLPRDVVVRSREVVVNEGGAVGRAYVSCGDTSR